MATTYALLVGVNEYRAVKPLRGCRNDVARAAEFLRAHHGDGLSLEDLCDETATKAAVVDAFRRHLGQAGPGDTALFWFSGHGSTAEVPTELWHLEALGEMQTMLCVDSREGNVGDLCDKELAVLIHEVASRGAHVAVVLDCCHAGGATRDADVDTRLRGVEPLAGPPPLESLLPELRLRDGDPVPAHLAPGGHPDHVALAACHPFQRAGERRLGQEVRGVFSWALLRALRQLDASATYRELLTAARCWVENLWDRQVPELYPAGGRLADQPFLGGQLRTPAAGTVMRYVRGGWEIDAGGCHGLAPGLDGDQPRVAVPGSDPLREALVRQVHAERSTVEPIGWEPDRHQQYPVVLSSVPMPPTRVAVDEAPAAGKAIQVAGPGGQPSPYLRVGEPAELVVSAPQPGTLQVRGPDGTALTQATSDLDQVVADLEHIARWRQVKALANPLSRLAGTVDIELVAPPPDRRTAPLDWPALPPGDDGSVHLAYRRGRAGWVAPTVFVRLRSRSDQRLFFVLLDLTDRFRLHAGLLPGAFVGSGQAAAAVEGGPVEFSLPPDEEVAPGASVQDWLLLLAAREEVSAELFYLPRLRDPRRAPLREPPCLPNGQTRGGLTGALDRLGLLALYRDADRPADTAYEWTTRILPVVTTVPVP